jgi:hypothetical protein
MGHRTYESTPPNFSTKAAMNAKTDGVPVIKIIHAYNMTQYPLVLLILSLANGHVLKKLE